MVHLVNITRFLQLFNGVKKELEFNIFIETGSGAGVKLFGVGL